jgi:hypothetical protein
VTTPLDKTLKRELTLKGRAFIVALSPEGLRITLKGKRKGQELRWSDLISGDAALAVALNASLGQFAAKVPAKAANAPAMGAIPRPKAANLQPKTAKPQPKEASAQAKAATSRVKAANPPPKKASNPRSKRRRTR